MRRVVLALLVFISCPKNIQPTNITTPASLLSTTQKTTSQPTSRRSDPPTTKTTPQPLAPLHTDWRWQSPTPQGNHLYGLHATKDALLAVGRNGAILRGGLSWSLPQSGTRAWLFDVFGNQTHLFAVGEGGVISRSIDGGERWTTTSLSHRLIFFGGASRGDAEHFIVGSQGTILTSKDNGARWVTLRSGDELLYQIHAASWGGLFAVGAKGVLLQSSDGASWKKTSLSLEEDLLSVTSSKEGLYLIGNKGTLWRSTDKGKTFTTRAISTKQLNGIWARDGVIVIAGNGGLLLRSTDDGESWATIKSPTSVNLISLEEVPERGLFVVGALGVIARSQDGGASWALESMGLYKPLYAAEIGSTRARWEYLFVGAVGSLYQIRPSQLYTYEESLRALTWGDLRGVKLLSSGWIIAIGEVGGIFLSKDGGESWSFQQKTGPLSSLAGDDALLTAVGAKGAIWSSSDQGQTWSQERSPTESALRSIWQSTSGDRFILGERGVLLRSRQGEWRSSVISSGREPRSIWGFQDKELYIVGDDGLLLRSDNAGDLWQQQKIDTKEDLNALWGALYDGHKALFIAGKDGLILRRSEAGDWRQEETPTDEDLFFIVGSPSGELFAGGASGVLLVSSWRTD